MMTALIMRSLDVQLYFLSFMHLEGASLRYRSKMSKYLALFFSNVLITPDILIICKHLDGSTTAILTLVVQEYMFL